MFPTLPSWDGMHPLVVHFPIALILVAPLFVVMSMIMRRYARPLAASALVLMVLGTAGAIAAVSTGEAAGELAERTSAAEAAIEQHEELAETTRTMLLIVTTIYVLIVLSPLVYQKVLEPIPSIALNGSFLILYVVAASFLANTAHQGGMLVHSYGIHAMVGPPAPGAAGVPAGDDEDEGEGR